jgi:catechol 2,3-dioxygenase-like lactoylglutathione lyase family enzyme
MAKKFFLNQLNVRNPKATIEFYKKLGFVDEPGFNQKEGAPVNPITEFAAKMGVDAANDSDQFGMLRLPGDNYHLEVGSWKPGKLAEPTSPTKFNQVGVVRLSFLVDDIDEELEDIKSKGIAVTYGPETLHLNWGTTRFAFFKDPDGTFVEFLEIKRS